MKYPCFDLFNYYQTKLMIYLSKILKLAIIKLGNFVLSVFHQYTYTLKVYTYTFIVYTVKCRLFEMNKSVQ